MNEELKVLKSIAKLLEDAKVFYMISGSMAANYYTVPRMTRDIDVVLELIPGDIERLIESLDKIFWVDSEVASHEASACGMFNVIHKDYLIKVDCIIGKDSEFQKSAFKRRKQVRIEDHPLWLISPEDLILAKLLWAQESLSEMQLNDVRHVLERKDLDRDYLSRWITKLGLVNLYEKVNHA